MLLPRGGFDAFAFSLVWLLVEHLSPASLCVLGFCELFALALVFVCLLACLLACLRGLSWLGLICSRLGFPLGGFGRDSLVRGV